MSCVCHLFNIPMLNSLLKQKIKLNFSGNLVATSLFHDKSMSKLSEELRFVASLVSHLINHAA